MGTVIDITHILREKQEEERFDALYTQISDEEWERDVAIANALRLINPEHLDEATHLLGDGRFAVGTKRIEKY